MLTSIISPEAAALPRLKPNDKKQAITQILKRRGMDVTPTATPLTSGVETMTTASSGLPASSASPPQILHLTQTRCRTICFFCRRNTNTHTFKHPYFKSEKV